MTEAQFHAVLRQLTRIADALEGIEEDVSALIQIEGRRAALDEFAAGTGKHPDD